MKKPKLTIGMPTFDDYHGCIFTLQSLRLNNDLKDVELIVIDNNPSSPGSPMIKEALEGPLRGSNAGTRYIPYENAIGPANAKNRVFAEANGKAVLCVDSHVLFKPNAIERLIQWYDNHPNSKDLICGPLIYDDLFNISTHFDDVWRGEMWGIWGSAWIDPTGIVFSILDEGGKTVAVKLSSGLGRDIVFEYTDFPFNEHIRLLIEKGCRPYGREPQDEFEIPGNGCGLISCRKDAWLYFNESFSGFGGEEMYIHEKFRKAGHKALCLGFLQWWHRFGRPEGVKFPLRRDQKVRNYILGHLELDMPLDRVYEHFVSSGLMNDNEWNILKLNAIGTLKQNNQINMEKAIELPEEKKLEPVKLTSELLYNQIKGIPRDLDKHMPFLAKLVERCPRITEFSDRRESFIAFAYGKPKKLVSYNSEKSNAAYITMLNFLKEENPETEIISESRKSIGVPSIEETDVLFLDQRHTEADVYRELSTYHKNVTTYIILHDTVLFGVSGEDGGPGLHSAMKKFLKENPEWFVTMHVETQYGLTVLAKKEEDRPKTKIRPWNISGGPGQELKEILSSLGINPSPDCGCNAKAAAMNSLGVAGCKEKRDEIISWIKENQVRWGWASAIQDAASHETEFKTPEVKPKTFREKAKVYWLGIKTGLVFKLSITDPIGSLVDLAIKRAEIKEMNGEYDE